MERAEIAGYRWDSAELNASHDYLLPSVRRELKRLGPAFGISGGAAFRAWLRQRQCGKCAHARWMASNRYRSFH